MNGHREKSQRFQETIVYNGKEYFFQAIILPAKKAPHVSADSPHFLEPGRIAQVLGYSLFDDYGEDVTGLYFFDHERMEIESLILHEWALDQTGARILMKEVAV